MDRGRRLRRRVAACLVALAIAQAAGYAGPAPEAADAATGRASASASREEALRVRKNVKALTRQERRDFVAAVRALKSVRSPFDRKLSYYDQFVAWHLSLYPCGMGHEMIRPHGGPMFLPWHRLFLLRFENALRKVSGKPITVPYWDWSDRASTPVVFADDFMGGDGDPDDDFAVKTGPFRKGRWALRVHPVGSQWSASATPYLTRHFGSVPGFTSLPTPADVRFVQERPRYDVAPYDPSSDPNLSFRNALEGFWQSAGPTRVPAGTMVCGPDGVMSTASGPAMHNLVHVWVGGLIGASPMGPRAGTMVLPTSPNDPVFFLHHANIDRLWAEWQDEHGVDTYEPVSCDQQALEDGCRANTGTDRMHPPFEATPADVADIRTLGYRYGTRTSAVSEDDDVVVLEGCKDRVAFVLGVEEAVRSRVPARYELVRDPGTGRPLLFVDAGLRCDSYTVGGRRTPTKIASVSAMVQSPDGEGCLSAAPMLGDLKADAVPVCNYYLLWDATNNAGYARFLRSGTPDFPISVIKALSWEESEFDPSRMGVPFRFRVGRRSPYQLASDFIVRERPGGGPFAAFFWTETAGGTVKLSLFADNVEFGEASGRVRTKPGSELAELFGGAVGQPAPGLSLISAVGWSRAVLTKTVIP